MGYAVMSSWVTIENFRQVFAYDQDIGENGRIEYSIKAGRGKGKFKIHPTTGLVYCQRGLEANQEFELLVSSVFTILLITRENRNLMQSE